MTTWPNPFLVGASTRGPPRSTHRSSKSPMSLQKCQDTVTFPIEVSHAPYLFALVASSCKARPEVGPRRSPRLPPRQRPRSPELSRTAAVARVTHPRQAPCERGEPCVQVRAPLRSVARSRSSPRLNRCKQRLGPISEQGDRYPRRLLVVGASSPSNLNAPRDAILVLHRQAV